MSAPAIADAASPPLQVAGRRDNGLTLIAVFKFSKVAMLLLGGFGALQTLRPEVARAARSWSPQLAFDDEPSA